MLEGRYAHLRLGLDEDRIVVEAVTQGATRRRMTTTASEAEEQFEANGINGHLRDKGPGANALREYVVEARRARLIVQRGRRRIRSCGKHHGQEVTCADPPRARRDEPHPPRAGAPSVRSAPRAPG